MLTRAALRITAVQALRGRTLAGDRIFDGELAQISESWIDRGKPFVCVYTSGATASAKAMGLMSPDEAVDLLLEMIVAGATDITPATDAGLELACDLLERQARVALSDPSSQWAELFRRFGRLGEVRVIRGSSETSEDGIRFAARQIRVAMQPTLEPAPTAGEIPDNWRALIDALAADPEPGIQAFAPVLEDALRGDGPEWAELAAQLGLTAAAAEGLGLAHDPSAPLPGDHDATLDPPA